MDREFALLIYVSEGYHINTITFGIQSIPFFNLNFLSQLQFISNITLNSVDSNKTPSHYPSQRFPKNSRGGQTPKLPLRGQNYSNSKAR